MAGLNRITTLATAPNRCAADLRNITTTGLDASNIQRPIKAIARAAGQ